MLKYLNTYIRDNKCSFAINGGLPMADTTTKLQAQAKDRDVPAKRGWEKPIVRKESIASMTQKSQMKMDAAHGTDS